MATFNQPGPLLSQETLARTQSARAVPSFPDELRGTLVRLTPLDPPRHVSELYQAANGSGPNGEPDFYDAEALIWRFMFGGPYTTEGAFRAYLDELHPMQQGLAVVIESLKDGRLAGLATFCSNHPAALRLELGGIWYGPSFQGRGINTETIYLMLCHAFDTLGYRRVEWKCDALNERSRRTALKLGFQFEGVFAQHMIVKGRNRDTAWFAMTDGMWPTAKAALEARIAAT